MSAEAVAWVRRAVADAAVAVRAPGRVNLIGDHTDYQQGLCLPLAIDRQTYVAAAARPGTRVRVRSRELAGTVDVRPSGDAPSGDAPSGEAVGPGWARSVVALLAALGEAGRPVGGADVAVASDVPLGSGLSSSAAFHVGVAAALTGLATLTGSEPRPAPLRGSELARVAQRAEHLAGVPCGLMDQMACVHARADHALLLDCRSLAVEHVAIPPAVSVVVVHSGLPRALADSEYAARRRACEAAAARLGVASLRDAQPPEVADDPIARHVVTENARVLRFADALRTGDLAMLGRLLDESHASLAGDFGVSTPELDRLCADLRAAGALGARLTGAGFGGCVVALARHDEAAAVAEEAGARYRLATGRATYAFVARAVGGAGPVAGPPLPRPQPRPTRPAAMPARGIPAEE